MNEHEEAQVITFCERFGGSAPPAALARVLEAASAARAVCVDGGRRAGMTLWRVSHDSDPRAARGAWLRLAEALAAAALGGIGAELDGPPDNPIAYDITEALLEAARLSVIVAARENRRAAPAA